MRLPMDSRNRGRLWCCSRSDRSASRGCVPARRAAQILALACDLLSLWCLRQVGDFAMARIACLPSPGTGVAGYSSSLRRSFDPKPYLSLYIYIYIYIEYTYSYSYAYAYAYAYTYIYIYILFYICHLVWACLQNHRGCDSSGAVAAKITVQPIKFRPAELNVLPHSRSASQGPEAMMVPSISGASMAPRRQWKACLWLTKVHRQLQNIPGPGAGAQSCHFSEPQPAGPVWSLAWQGARMSSRLIPYRRLTGAT